MIKNCEQIIAALDEVLNEDGDLYKATARKASGLPSESGEGLLNHLLSKPVKKALQNQDEFRPSAGFLVQQESGYTGFQSRVAAEALVKRARETGSSGAAVEWLKTVLSTTEAKGSCVMALWGVNTDKAVTLRDDIELVPFDDLPPSNQKRAVENPQYAPGMLRQGPMMFKPPAVALVGRTTIKPFLIDLRKGKPTKQKDPLKWTQLLDEVRLCLTVVGPCTPVEAAYWFQFENEALQAASLGGTYLQHIEILPAALPVYGDFDGDIARAVVKGYRGLQGKIRDKVRIALDRLNQAMRRRYVGDKALELAIALEVLLAEGGGENTWKVGLRAALLIGGDADVRRHNRAIIGGIYSLRSSLVHNGSVSTRVSLKGGEGRKKTEGVVRDGIVICAAVIRSVIAAGDTPDWYTYELTGAAENAEET